MTTTGPGAVGARPPWRRWLLAALPWVAGGVLAVGGLAARGSTATTDAVASPDPATAPSPAAPAAAADVPAATTSPAALPTALELTVLATARTSLGTAGLPVVGPAPDRWPLEVRVADVRRLDDGVALVRVLGLVIEQDAGAWQAPSVRAVVVPVRLEPTTAVLGAAWPVTAPALTTETPAGREADGVGPAVVAALEDAGWVVEEVTSVELVLGHHLRVALRGAPPDDDAVADHTVWLRDDPGGPRPLATTTTPTTATTTRTTQETP